MLNHQEANPKQDYRKNSGLMKQLRSVFVTGLDREDFHEAVHLRQYAYMFLLNITQREMKEKITAKFELYKGNSQKMYSDHFTDKGHLKRESSKNQRLLSQQSPLFNAIYLIQKDVNRTMCVFDENH